MEEQIIDVTVGSTDFEFCVSTQDYNKLVNSMSANNKINPSHNFCVATVKPEQKEALLVLLANPGVSTNIVGAVIEEYVPDIEVAAKKRSNGRTTSKKTS